jgi:hypothetical protein
MADETTLQMIISASFDQFQEAMANIGSSAQSAMDRLRETFGEAGDAGNASMQKLSESTTEASNSMAEQFNSMRESAKHVLEVLGAFEALRWGKEQVMAALEAGEQLQRMSQITGIAQQQLQVLNFAATATGGSLQQLAGFAEQVQRQVVGIQSGGNQRTAGVLKAAGIDPASIHDAQSALTALEGAVQRFGAQSQQVRNVLSTIGGRSGLQLEPMLAALPEMTQKFQEMGLAISDGMVAQLDHANESMNIVSAAAEALRNKMVAALATPTIELAANLAEQLETALNKAANNGQLATMGEAIMHGMAGAAEAALTFANDIYKAVEYVNQVVGGIEHITSALDQANNAIDDFADRAHDAYAAFMRQHVEGMKALTDTAPNFGISGGGGWSDAKPKAASGVGDIPGLDAMNAALTKAVASTDKLEAGLRRVHDTPPPPPPPTPAGGSGGHTHSAALAELHKEAEAARQLQAQKFEAARSEASLETALAGSTAEAKIAADQKVLAAAVSIYGAQSQQARAAMVKVLDDQRSAIANNSREMSGLIQDSAHYQVTNLQNKKSMLPGEQKLGQIDGSERLAQEKTLDDQIFAIREAMYAKLAALPGQNEAALVKIQSEMKSNEQTHAQQIDQINQQSAMQVQESWTQASNAMRSVSEQFVNGAITGTLNLRAIMLQTFQQMADAFLEKLIQMIGQSLLFQTIWSGIEALVGSGGSSTIANLAAQQMAQARLAGAAVMAQIAQLPFPIDLTAPAVGASFFASAMAFAGGGIVPGHGNSDSVLSALTPGEAVIPKALTEHLMRAANMTPPSARTMPSHAMIAPDDARGPRGFGGEANRPAGHHIETHVHISSLDSQSFTDRIDEHKEHITRAVFDAANRLGVSRYDRVG